MYRYKRSPSQGSNSSSSRSSYSTSSNYSDSDSDNNSNSHQQLTTGETDLTTRSSLINSSSRISTQHNTGSTSSSLFGNISAPSSSSLFSSIPGPSPGNFSGSLSSSLFSSIPGPSSGNFSGSLSSSLFSSIPGPSHSSHSEESTHLPKRSLFDDIPGPQKKTRHDTATKNDQDDGMFSGKVFDVLLSGTSSSSKNKTQEEIDTSHIFRTAFPNMLDIEVQSYLGQYVVQKRTSGTKMTLLEYCALRLYMAKGDYHKILNDNERSREKNPKLAPVRDALIQALEKTKIFHGLSFRGEDRDRFENNILSEGSYFESDFMSTSTKNHLVDYYMKEYKNINKRDKQTRYIVAGKSGALLSDSVNDEALDEVLFPTGTTFKVLFRHQPKPGETPVQKIILEEVGLEENSGRQNRLTDALDLAKSKKKL